MPLADGSVNCVVSAASHGGRTIASGEIVDILGKNIGPAQNLFASVSAGHIDTALAGVQLRFNGVPAPLLAIGFHQMRAVVPYEAGPIDLATRESATIQILNGSSTAWPFVAPVTAVAPSIFTVDGRPTGQVLMTNEDGTLNSKQNPARQGSIVTIYATGLNNTQPALPTGTIATGVAPLTFQAGLQLGSAGFGQGEITYAGASGVCGRADPDQFPHTGFDFPRIRAPVPYHIRFFYQPSGGYFYLQWIRGEQEMMRVPNTEYRSQVCVYTVLACIMSPSSVIMRCFLFLLGAPLLSFAQFSNLATSATGDRVFFVTPLRQPGLNQFPHDKLFLLDLVLPPPPPPPPITIRQKSLSVRDTVAGGLPIQGPVPSTLSLAFQRPWTGGPFYHNGFAPTNVTASADGRYVAFTTFAGCVGGSSCFFRELASGSVLDVASGNSIFDGLKVWVSRNGRYVLSQPTSGAPSNSPSTVTVLDRTTNETRRVPAGSVVALSSKGDVLLYNNGLELVPWNGPPRIFQITGAKAMDDAATTILFTNPYDNLDQARLFVYDIASGRQWQLGPDDRASYSPTLSDDGQWVLYLTKLGDTPQLMLSHPDGSNWKQLTAEAYGISSGVSSGDAHVAWAATKDGRLLRIATDNLHTDQVLAPPVFTDSSWNVVPGSLLRLNGYRLSTNVHIEGTPVPSIAVTDSEVDVQVPWDLPQPPNDYGSFDLNISSTRDDSPLEAVTQEYSAYWSAYYPQGWMAAIHQDWSSLVSSDNPAHPGEIVHIYATGLGPTTCTVANDEPAPVNHLCTPTKAIDWTWWWTSTDAITADVPFAGLAPGLIGLYQIEARVPTNPPAARLKLIADRNGNFAVADIPLRQQ